MGSSAKISSGAFQSRLQTQVLEGSGQFQGVSVQGPDGSARFHLVPVHRSGWFPMVPESSARFHHSPATSRRRFRSEYSFARFRIVPDGSGKFRSSVLFRQFLDGSGCLWKALEWCGQFREMPVHGSRRRFRRLQTQVPAGSARFRKFPMQGSGWLR